MNLDASIHRDADFLIREVDAKFRPIFERNGFSQKVPFLKGLNDAKTYSVSFIKMPVTKGKERRLAGLGDFQIIIRKR